LAIDECLRILEENLVLQVQEQLVLFDRQIRAISKRKAATGRSGAAIREVMDLFIQILRSRAEHILLTLSTLPFEYSVDLATKISEISLKYFPTDLGELRPGIEEIIRVCHGNHIRERVFNEIVGANETEIQRFLNGLDRFLLNIKIKIGTQFSDLEVWAGGDQVTLAIVFTDMVGSIALGQELGGELMESVRQAHFEQTRRLLHKYQGWEIKTTGDGFMVAFRNVADALDFAIKLISNTGYAKIKIRVGIHIGIVQIKANDAYSDTVNFTSRIIKSIEGAEVRISDRAKEDIDLLRANRHHNLKWEQLEEIEMKGFPGKHTLWSLAL
jgi:class 3 adenylate cyclase